MKKLKIYTDGACSGNPGKGGYGVILVFNKYRKELSGGYRLTTNNRMEIISIIIGLEALTKLCNVTIYSDSRYVVDTMNKGWASKWQSNNWKRNKQEIAKNSDLWKRLLDLCTKHNVQFIWVKGHSGHPENERCDQLAVLASKRMELFIDKVFESTVN
ncbi:ribonuclease HI [Candidatus Atelocyanobacterium thalassae]|uniref:Ribonuclease H n=1 Tax=Atelocyanobacterium thalassa (isolate ALOHA) TaxID=1453429 RepID=D3EMY4_ATETH|nr:ribonuclease HI [Candidatus Atelocyanobacterium thalassa]ADB94834.1 RNase HI [Candidatus Atelocyanobacterium thalassa isolate ALOHA]